MRYRFAVDRRHVLLAMMLPILATTAGLSPAVAQTAPTATFPDRPIRLIVPYPAGGPSDVMGRLIAQTLSDALRQQVFVDNRPGAGSILGGKMAASADPDGYTLLLASAATLAIGPTLYPDAGLDPRSFVPVANFSTVPFVLIVGPKSPLTSVAALIAYAKSHPGKLTIGVPNGAPPHMLAAWFKSLTATDILIVPYKGASTEMTDLIGGQIDLAIETTSVVLPHLPDGSMRALAVTTAERLPEIPAAPTMIESGVPGFLASSWMGVVAPPGTPQPIIDKLNAAINAGLRTAALQAKFKLLGAQGDPGTPAQFGAFIAAEVPKWTAMAKLSGLNTQ